MFPFKCYQQPVAKNNPEFLQDKYQLCVSALLAKLSALAQFSCELQTADEVNRMQTCKLCDPTGIPKFTNKLVSFQKKTE